MMDDLVDTFGVVGAFLILLLILAAGLLWNNFVYGDATCLFKQCVVVKGEQ